MSDDWPLPDGILCSECRESEDLLGEVTESRRVADPDTGGVTEHVQEAELICGSCDHQWTWSRKDLKYASGPQTTLALAQEAGSLAATVRYEDEKGIRAGDALNVLSANTEDRIGTAIVKHATTVPVRQALDVIAMWWAEYQYTERDYLLSALNDYYDDTIDLSTEVKVILVDPDLSDESIQEVLEQVHKL